MCAKPHHINGNFYAAAADSISPAASVLLRIPRESHCAAQNSSQGRYPRNHPIMYIKGLSLSRPEATFTLS